jgi:hypothetical protein
MDGEPDEASMPQTSTGWNRLPRVIAGRIGPVIPGIVAKGFDAVQ